MDWKTFIGNLPHALFIAKSNQVGQKTNVLQYDGASVSASELYSYDISYNNINNDNRQKWSFEICINRKEKLNTFFLWAGNRSLEIYMLHGLLFSGFKSNVMIPFESIKGYLVTIGNFVLTMVLCAAIINLLNHNIILKRLLRIR